MGQCMRLMCLVSVVALALVGLGLPYYYAHFGIFFNDEPYQIMLVLDNANNPAGPLGGLAAGVWMRFFGHGLLSMRCLSIVYSQLAVFVAAWFMWHVTRRRLYTLAVTAVALCLLPFCFQLVTFGWDAVSALAVTLTTVATLMYLRCATTPRLIAMAICAGAAAMVRLPDFLLLFVVMAAIVYKSRAEGGRVAVLRLLWAVIAFGAVCAAVILAVFKTPAEYVHQLQVNMVTNHTPLVMVKVAYANACLMMRYALMFIGTYVCVKVICRFFDNRWMQAAALFAMAFVWTKHLIFFDDEDNCETQWYMIDTLFLCIAGYALYATPRGRSRSPFVVAMLVCVAGSLMGAAGSNTGLIKLLCVPLLPVLFALCGRRLPRKMLVTLGMLAVVIFITGCRNRLHTAFEYPRRQPGVLGSVYEPVNPLFKGVRTSYENKLMLDSITSAVERNPDCTIVASGETCERFVIDYISGHRTHVHANNWNLILSTYPPYISDLDAHLRSIRGPVAVILLDTPGYAGSPLDCSLSQPTPNVRVITIPYPR